MMEKTWSSALSKRYGETYCSHHGQIIINAHCTVSCKDAHSNDHQSIADEEQCKTHEYTTMVIMSDQIGTRPFLWNMLTVWHCWYCSWMSWARGCMRICMCLLLSFHVAWAHCIPVLWLFHGQDVMQTSPWLCEENRPFNSHLLTMSWIRIVRAWSECRPRYHPPRPSINTGRFSPWLTRTGTHSELVAVQMPPAIFLKSPPNHSRWIWQNSICRSDLCCLIAASLRIREEPSLDNKLHRNVWKVSVKRFPCLTCFHPKQITHGF